jgi:Tfp pilus assembly protein PilF
MSGTGARLAVAAGIVVLVWAVFAQVRHHDFVNYDDRIYVVENPMLKRGLGPDTLARAFRPYENNWIPLTWISLQVGHALHGMSPAGFLLSNVALHAASAVLLFALLLQCTGALGRSAFVAAVFAVHPLHVESVAWVSERKDALSGLFFMLTLWAWVRYARQPGIARYAAVLLALALGLMAKPMLVTLPLVLLLLDHWPLERLRRAPGRALWEKLPLLALAALAAGITFAVQRATGAMAGQESLPLGWRFANALDAQLAYLVHVFWPSGLAPFYPHPGRDLPLWRAGVAGALLLGITAATLRLWRSRPYAVVGWLWYLGMMLPVSGLVQVGLQARADRYTYLPLIGLSIAVAWGAHDLVRARRALAGAAALATAALAAVAWLQVDHWRDTGALFARAVAVTRDNYLAHHAVGTELLRAGRPEEARPHFEEALRIKPSWPGAHFGLAEALSAEGEHAAALARYQAGLRLAPRNLRGRIGYGKALADAGRYEEAIHQLRRALRKARGRQAARAHALLARSLAASDDLDGALEHYRTALELDPGYAEAHANFGSALLRAGRLVEAESELRRSLELGADSTGLRLALAESARALGHDAAAAAHYQAALEREPGSRAAANNLGWLLATHPRLRDPQRAVEVTSAFAASDEPALLDTLAAAYAAAGRYADAVAAAERAVDLAGSRGDAALAADIRSRLALYRSGRPYVESGP